jgi:predicted GIY-YIG superfamily endonuclease
MDEAIIYVLCEPDTNEVRYVGHTKDLAKRVKMHMESPSSDGMCKWVNFLSAAGQQPVAKVIETVSWEERYAKEREHRERLLGEGCNLLNQVGNRKYWDEWWAKGYKMQVHMRPSHQP